MSSHMFSNQAVGSSRNSTLYQEVLFKVPLVCWYGQLSRFGVDKQHARWFSSLSHLQWPLRFLQIMSQNIFFLGNHSRQYVQILPFLFFGKLLKGHLLTSLVDWLRCRAMEGTNNSSGKCLKAKLGWEKRSAGKKKKLHVLFREKPEPLW